MSSTTVFNHAKKMTDAIVCLRDGGHHVAALMLSYAALDQMAWLSIERDKSEPNDFKSWVTTYILSKNNLSCTADELWAARNGLLHMGTADSAAHWSDTTKNKIYYTFGNVTCTTNNSPDTIFLKSEDLIQAYLAGVLWFMSDLEQDQAKLRIAVTKIERVLTSHGL